MKSVIRRMLLGVMAVVALCAVAASGYWRSARRLAAVPSGAVSEAQAVSAQSRGVSATVVEQGSSADAATELLRLREKERTWTAELNRREEAVRTRLKAVFLAPAKPGRTQVSPPRQAARVRTTLAELQERNPQHYAVVLRTLQQAKQGDLKRMEVRREALAGLDPALLPEEQFRQLREYLEMVQRFDTEELEPEERKRLEAEVLRTMFQVMPLARRYDYASQGKDAEEMERREKAIAVLQHSPIWFPQLPVLERGEE